MKKMVLAIVILFSLAGTTLIVHSRRDPASPRTELKDRNLASTVPIETSVAMDAAGATADPDGDAADRTPPAKTEAESDPAIVEGRIVAPDGTPVPDIELYLHDEGILSLALFGGTPAEPPIIRTDTEGRFRFVYAPLRDLQKRRRRIYDSSVSNTPRLDHCGASFIVFARSLSRP